MFDNTNNLPEKEFTKPKHNINNAIKAKDVLLIDENDQKVGVVNIRDALYKAQNVGLDLVEVNSGKVPVCKIMDYKKIQYEQKKLAKKNAHHHAKEIKEIRFTPNTGDHDIDIKAKHIKEFLNDGHKVRLTVKFRGREGKHTELGVEVINKAFDHIGRDIFNIDQPINMDAGALGATISAKKV